MRLRSRLRSVLRLPDVAAGTRIHATAMLDRAWPQGLHVAPGCTVAEDAILLTHDIATGRCHETWVGPRSVIGERAIVLPGVRIGSDCVVAAGAVVASDMPDGSHAAGNPATVAPIAR